MSIPGFRASFARHANPFSRSRITARSWTRTLASASSDKTSTHEPDPSRAQSSPASKDIDDAPDVETASLSRPGPTEEQIASYDPVARAKGRKVPLPSSRYKFRPPRYYRGPLHPHQPPPKTDPNARDFVPGPFSLPRLVQTYNNVLAADLMTLFYDHIPPGTPQIPRGSRLREWDDSSPYHKNRPKRGPRGGSSSLPLLRKNITFHNIPKISKITVHSLVRDAPSSSAHLHAAGMVVQALTAQRAVVHIAKKSSAAGQRTSFTQKEGKPISVTATIQGEQMWHFLSTLISIVLPRIKDYKGMKVKAGDRSGNLQLGLSPETVGIFPEVGVNYDAYPPQMIPGVDIILHTTAAEDRDARVLLTALGLPFQSGGTY